MATYTCGAPIGGEVQEAGPDWLTVSMWDRSYNSISLAIRRDPEAILKMTKILDNLRTELLATLPAEEAQPC